MTSTNHNGVYIFGKNKSDTDKQPYASATRINEAIERTKKYTRKSEMNVQIGKQNVIKCSNIISGTAIINGTVIVNGVELPPPPTGCHNTTIINNKVYIDGYEFKHNKWRKTLRAWWHLWF